jgi:hypothetical protein
MKHFENSQFKYKTELISSEAQYSDSFIEDKLYKI